jgi:hypothetical protein
MIAILATDCCKATALVALRSGQTQRCACGAVLIPPVSSNLSSYRPPLSWLELLARWLPTIEGRGMSIEPQIRGSARDGRSDSTDERHHELQRALAAHRYLETLPERSREVLRYAYVRLGAEARGREESLHDAIGWAFVTKAQKQKWLKLPKALKREAPRRHGRELLIAACAAWEG